MADQQPGNGPAEPLSYDADLTADVRGAWDEVSTETPAPAEPETPAPAEPAAPTEPKAEHPTDPTRYADGKFKPIKEDVPQQAANEQHAKAALEQQPQAQPRQPQAQLPNTPPGRWSPLAKSAWDAEVPSKEQWAAIKESALRGEQEVAEGFAQYEGMRELRPFVDLARSQGQSAREVVERYIGAEQHLRQDFIGGMVNIGSGMGYTPQQIALAMAQRFLGPGYSNGQDGAPAGTQMPESGTQMPDPAYLQQWLNPLAQEVSTIRAYLQQQQQAERSRQEGAINSVLQRVMSDPNYRYFANVEDGVVHALQLMTATGQRTGNNEADLQAAYRSACLNHPEVSKLFLKEQLAKEQAVTAQQQKEAAEKARHASRSITGSPSTGASRDFGDDDGSVEADVRRAFRAHAV